LPGKATIRPSEEKQISTKPLPPPFAGVSDAFDYVQLVAHDDYQSFSFFIFACVSPARTAASLSSIWFKPANWPLFLALSMGSLPRKAGFRLAVSEILKEGHVICIIYGVMFYS
jgi:hypothetical protein